MAAKNVLVTEGGSRSLYDLDGKANAASLPKRYKWIGDGAATTGTVVANTLGVTINVTNPSPGQYTFTAASGTPFATGKTTISVQVVSSGNVFITDADDPSASTTVQNAYFFIPAETPADPVKYQVIIEVEP